MTLAHRGREATNRPRQAVMVAGGRGERLRPLTDLRPKPMIEFHGRPFLDYLLEMLAEQGFQRVLLLLGYRAEAIIDHVGYGSRHGLEVTWDVTPPEAQTGRRMWAARERIEPSFLFLYCDNYWPMDAERMWRRFSTEDADAMLTIYRNDDGYSRDNVTVDEATGRITRYDRTRSTEGLSGVELGYAFMRKSVLELLDGTDTAFEDAVYPALVTAGRLSAWVSDHRYYSVGTLQRLPLTDAFLRRTPTVLLDRDGVLNERPPRAEYVRRADELRWLPGAREALRLFAEAGYRVIVVSNQAGIARGALTDGDLGAIHVGMLADAQASGGRIDAFYHCPHDWDEGCRCRKPAPGMLIDAQRDFDLDLSRTTFIGDDDRDRQAAEAAGTRFRMVTPSVSLLDHARELAGQPLSGPLAGVAS